MFPQERSILKASLPLHTGDIWCSKEPGWWEHYSLNQRNVGFVDVTVTQTPRYLVKRMGEKVLLECKQDMDHNSMFWYRQDPGLGPRLIYLSFDVSSHNKGDIPEGYSVSREQRDHFLLSLESASINQTSVYLCASSLSTALHSHILFVQKRTSMGGK